MKLIIIAVSILSLAGCFTSQREEQSATVSEETRTGVEGGKATNVHIVRREQTQTDAKASAGVDVDAAIKAAVAAASGNITDLVASLKPPDLGPIMSSLSKLEAKPSGGTDWAALAEAAGAALLPAAGAAHLLNKGKKDAEARAYAANERAIAYAERVDPETAGTYKPQDPKAKPTT